MPAVKTPWGIGLGSLEEQGTTLLRVFCLSLHMWSPQSCAHSAQSPHTGRAQPWQLSRARRSFLPLPFCWQAELPASFKGPQTEGTDFLIVTGPCFIPVCLAAALLSALQEAEHLLAMCSSRQQHVRGVERPEESHIPHLLHLLRASHLHVHSPTHTRGMCLVALAFGDVDRSSQTPSSVVTKYVLWMRSLGAKTRVSHWQVPPRALEGESRNIMGQDSIYRSVYRSRSTC